MMKYLTDPKLFNVVILGLFALTTIRWTFAGNPRQAVYWASAFALNYAITFLPEGKI